MLVCDLSLRRDPGLALVVLGLVLAVALYAPTLRRGLVDYDDPWLVGGGAPSLSSLHAIAFDLSPPTRYQLGAEYLPVRDVSIAVDRAVWGTWYPGFHLTNLAVYLASIALWFFALCALGIDRRVCGLAMLLWAIHPSHAESVAWLSERKGLLAALFAGACVLGYARYRAGASARWLVLAVVAAVAAVWSKAPAAFVVAALAPLELVVPARRVSARRSVVALAAVGVACALAFVPVIATALTMSVISGHDPRAPAGWLAMALGVHGFDIRLASMTVANAISYPIQTHGPSALDLVIGAVALAAAVAVAVLPRIGRWRLPGAARVAAILWLAGWLPASRLVLPVRKVIVADRYLMFPTLGLALAIALVAYAIPMRRAAIALVAGLAVAAGLRTFAAQATWRDATALWERALDSNPDDGDAWSFYAEQLADHGDQLAADIAVADGLRRSHAPKLLLRDALFSLDRGDTSHALARLREAAAGGEPFAMADLALVLSSQHELGEALTWARRAVDAGPEYPSTYRALGQVALAAGHIDEAIAALDHAIAFVPDDAAARALRAVASVFPR